MANAHASAPDASKWKAVLCPAIVICGTWRTLYIFMFCLSSNTASPMWCLQTENSGTFMYADQLQRSVTSIEPMWRWGQKLAVWISCALVQSHWLLEFTEGTLTVPASWSYYATKSFHMFLLSFWISWSLTKVWAELVTKHSTGFWLADLCRNTFSQVLLSLTHVSGSVSRGMRATAHCDPLETDGKIFR